MDGGKAVAARLCIECVHYEKDPTFDRPRMGLCGRTRTTSLVDGSSEATSCAMERTALAGCGESGRNFERRRAPEAA